MWHTLHSLEYMRCTQTPIIHVTSQHGPKQWLDSLWDHSHETHSLRSAQNSLTSKPVASHPNKSQHDEVSKLVFYAQSTSAVISGSMTRTPLKHRKVGHDMQRGLLTQHSQLYVHKGSRRCWRARWPCGESQTGQDWQDGRVAAGSSSTWRYPEIHKNNMQISWNTHRLHEDTLKYTMTTWIYPEIHATLINPEIHKDYLNIPWNTQTT